MASVWIRRLLLAVAVVLAVVSIVQVVRLAPVPDPPEPEQPAAAPALEAQTLPAAPAKPAARWTVGIWQGRVAVFEGELTAPIRVMETPVTALPDADRKALEAGIPVDDPVMLASLLEDYGS